MSRASLLANAVQRAAFGCITTWENEDGKTYTMTRAGPPSIVLRAMCDAAETLDPTFRLVSYSNPSTIHDDLVGRMPVRHSSGHWIPNATPEVAALAGVGRSDLLHPRIRHWARRA